MFPEINPFVDAPTLEWLSKNKKTQKKEQSGNEESGNALIPEITPVWLLQQQGSIFDLKISYLKFSHSSLIQNPSGGRRVISYV